ncbi:MAG: hypothetical protein RIB97_01045 [Nitratireductor sp.]
MASTRIALWQFTRDPALIAFLKRGVGGTGPQPAVARAPRPRDLDGGSARPIGFSPATEFDRETDAFGTLALHIGRGERFAVRVLEDA